MENQNISYEIGYFSAVIAAAAIGAAILFLPPFSILMGILAIVIFALYDRLPRLTLFFFAAFLIFQSSFAVRLGETSYRGIILKRSEEVLILGFFIIGIYKNYLRGHIWNSTSIDIPLVFLILIGITASVQHQFVPYLVASLDMFLLLKGFMVFYIFYNLEFSPESALRGIKLFLGIAMVVFLLGLLDFAEPVFFRKITGGVEFIDYRSGIPSVQSIFSHPGGFGWLMMIAAFFSVSCFLFYKIRKYMTFSVIYAIGVFMSMRVRIILGLLIAITAGIIMVRGSKKIKFLIIAIMICALFIALFGAKMKILFEDKIFNYFHLSFYTIEARAVLYATSFRIASDYFPLGAGFGTFGGWISCLYYSPLYIRYGINSVYGLQKGGDFIMDTFWPYIIGQFGILGLMAYAVIIYRFFHPLIKCFNRIVNVESKIITLGTTMLLIGTLIQSVADPVFLSPPTYFFIFASLGITFSLIRTRAYR